MNINTNIIREMKLEPILDRFGSMENLLDLYFEMIDCQHFHPTPEERGFSRTDTMIASIYREVKNPIDILEVYEEYRAGRIDRLPPWFLKGTDGLCNAVLVIIHACEQYNVDFDLINDEIVTNSHR